MADPFSLATGIISLTASCAKLGVLCGQLITDYQNAPQDIQNLSEELSGLCTILGRLQGFSSGLGRLLPTQLVEDLVPILNSCMDLFVRTELIVGKLRKAGKSSLARMRWALRDNEIEELRKSMGVHKLTLNVTLTMATCLSNQQLQHSQEVIHTKLDELLVHAAMVKVRNRRDSGISNVVLRRFVDGMSSYAGSVFSPSPRASSEYQESERIRGLDTAVLPNIDETATLRGRSPYVDPSFARATTPPNSPYDAVVSPREGPSWTGAGPSTPNTQFFDPWKSRQSSTSTLVPVPSRPHAPHPFLSPAIGQPDQPWLSIIPFVDTPSPLDSHLSPLSLDDHPSPLQSQSAEALANQHRNDAHQFRWPSTTSHIDTPGTFFIEAGIVTTLQPISPAVPSDTGNRSQSPFVASWPALHTKTVHAKVLYVDRTYGWATYSLHYSTNPTVLRKQITFSAPPVLAYETKSRNTLHEEEQKRIELDRLYQRWKWRVDEQGNHAFCMTSSRNRDCPRCSVREISSVSNLVEI